MGLRRGSRFYIYSWGHTEELNYVWICLKIILKYILKKKRLRLREKKVIWSMYNLKMTVIIHDTRQNRINILTSWSSCEILLWTYIGAHRLLMLSYATFPAHWSAQNHLTFLRSSSKALESLISHCIIKALFFVMQTHTHTHTHTSK